MSKTILITGAGSGLGKGTALGLAKKGHKVIATCEIWPQVTELRATAEQEGVEITATKMDLLSKEDREIVFKKYGDKIDILVANAATGETGPVAEIPVDRIRRVFEVNVFSTLEFVQPFARHFFLKDKGKIIFTSSTAGFFTLPFLSAYCASKHALEALAQLMYQEMEGSGVQVATINPGPYRTGFNDRMYDTIDHWYDCDQHFTPEKPIRDMQEQLAGNDLQLDPQEMIEFMVETIPQDNHKFRNVYPPRFIDVVKEYQESLWDIEV